MKVNYYALKNRDVIYLKEVVEHVEKKGFGKNKYEIRKLSDNNLLRIENVDGHINVSLLPNNFTPETGATFLTINPQTAMQFAAVNSSSDFIVKQGKKGEELGMYLLDSELNCQDLDRSEFSDYATIVASANKYDANCMDFMLDLYNNAWTMVDKFPNKTFPFTVESYDPFNIIILQQFDYLAEQRKENLENQPEL